MENVDIILGPSETNLPAILKSIDAPTTFWLDAHSDRSSPILEELDAIDKYGRKYQHTILIDDMRICETHWGIARSAVFVALYVINPYYDIKLIDSKAHPSDILTAVPGIGK